MGHATGLPPVSAIALIACVLDRRTATTRPATAGPDNSSPEPERNPPVTLDANKDLVRRMFEEVFRAGDPSAVRHLVATGIVDHDPMPGQPAGVEGIEYVVSTLHTAYPDLRFTVDDLVAESDRVAIRWTMRGTNTGPMLGQPPSSEPVHQTAIVIFRIVDGKIAERWAGFSPRE